MIEFRCNNCSHQISVPDNYAGKSVRCPQCDGMISVPGAVGQTGTQESGIIKFRCPGCNQKIGVKSEYAGKRIRCTKCKSPLRVPQASSRAGITAAKDEAVSSGAGQEQRSADKGIWDDLDFDNLRLTEAGSPSARCQAESIAVDGESGDNKFPACTGRLPGLKAYSERGKGKGPLKKRRTMVFILVAFVLVLCLAGVVFWSIGSEAESGGRETGDVLTNSRFVGVFLVVILVLVVVQMISMWIVFEKAGEPGWAILVPVYNLWVMSKVGGKPGWLGLLMFFSGFIPIAGPIVWVVLLFVISIGIAQTFGRGVCFGIGLALLPIIFFPILAFTSDIS